MNFVHVSNSCYIYNDAWFWMLKYCTKRFPNNRWYIHFLWKFWRNFQFGVCCSCFIHSYVDNKVLFCFIHKGVKLAHLKSFAFFFRFLKTVFNRFYLNVCKNFIQTSCYNQFATIFKKKNALVSFNTKVTLHQNIRDHSF